MKQKLILFIVFVMLVILGLNISKGESANGAVSIVEKTVSQYKNDTGFNGSCTLDGKKASLEGIVLGKIAMDSGYGTKGLGAKYNNRGNIKKAQQRKLPKQTNGYTINKDGGNYYVYPTVEEGLYDVAERAKRRGGDKCTISYATTYCYVKGCKNGVKDDAFVWDYYRGMVSVSKSYDAGLGLNVIDNEETRKQSANISGDSGSKTSYFNLAKAAERRREVHIKKAQREANEAQKMRAKCVAEKKECLD